MAVRINNIEIPESERNFLISVYQSKYKDLLARKEAVLEEEESMMPILLALGIVGEEGRNMNLFQANRLQSIFNTFILHFDLFGESKYSTDWTWLQKCKHIIEVAGEPLTSNEILEVIVKFYESNIDRQKAINSIPATLSVAAKEGKLVRLLKDGEYIYGL